MAYALKHSIIKGPEERMFIDDFAVPWLEFFRGSVTAARHVKTKLYDLFNRYSRMSGRDALQPDELSEETRDLIHCLIQLVPVGSTLKVDDAPVVLCPFGVCQGRVDHAGCKETFEYFEPFRFAADWVKQSAEDLERERKDLHKRRREGGDQWTPEDETRYENLKELLGRGTLSVPLERDDLHEKRQECTKAAMVQWDGVLAGQTHGGETKRPKEPLHSGVMARPLVRSIPDSSSSSGSKKPRHT